ncbi:proline--tRNA ligase [Thermosediminibacter oceani]|uniref:YbaK/prolyl-tRNA synthetase associated region n=1 Tax=Thermosediminibacter oceani (strain ATCC BAA-1034 / DSM 16646 / JW/IW-1228P) TaxID=555079 RepID=D9S3M4_THEOJ|nr:YbaK/EbsC family protein [Thermosediminibacter oceani]ADL08001.1 YbaK/prolyl-tRNA synthetase associated region [Thermosediminibacter oceani DSM 16646]
MRMTEIFPATLFNLPAGITGRAASYLYKGGILRTGETSTLFTLGVKVLRNIVESIEGYLKSSGFKEVIQKRPSYMDLQKEVTSPKQLPLFFYSFSAGGLQLDLYQIGESTTTIKHTINNILERYSLDIIDVDSAENKISKVVMLQGAPLEFFKCPACRYSTTGDFPLDYHIKAAPTEEEKSVEKVYTPDKRTIKDLCDFLGVKPEHTIKTMIYRALVDGEEIFFAALVPGSRSVDEKKLKVALGAQELDLANIETVERLTGAPHGFAGPCGLDGVKIIADTEISGMNNAVTGANEKDYHLINVNPGRDFHIDILADIKETSEGDPCPACAKPLKKGSGIEVAEWKQISSEGKKMEAGALFLENLILAIAEKHCDDSGLIWPDFIAPYKVVVIPVNTKDERLLDRSIKVYEELNKIMPTIIDDRPQSPGVKFKDAELLGFPIRITIGPRSLEKGVAEINLRRTGEMVEVEFGRITEKVCEMLNFPPCSGC